MIKYLTKDNKTIPYIILVKNNKNSYFKFKKEYIEIIKSKYLSDEKIIDILLINFDKYYEKFMNISNTSPSENEIYLQQEKFNLKVFSSNKFRYEIINNKINVYSKTTDITKIKHAIYKEELTKMINEIDLRVKIILEKNKIYERKIILGYYKTKFGSYHKKHDYIKLNIVLAKLDINYLFYVLLHEYAHTKVFNHSKDFYDLLEKLMPNYKYYDKNLKSVSIWL